MDLTRRWCYLCDKHSHQHDPSTLELEAAEEVGTLYAHPRPSQPQMADHRAPLRFALLTRCRRLAPDLGFIPQRLSASVFDFIPLDCADITIG